jgi:hypothetical protein
MAKIIDYITISKTISSYAGLGLLRASGGVLESLSLYFSEA